jgi:hypothetical protein
MLSHARPPLRPSIDFPAIPLSHIFAIFAFSMRPAEVCAHCPSAPNASDAGFFEPAVFAASAVHKKKKKKKKNRLERCSREVRRTQSLKTPSRERAPKTSDAMPAALRAKHRRDVA